VPAKNLARSAVGRAFAAVRDRDLAAEVMGVSLTRHKLIAFTISSFYAGIAGALLPTITGFIEPGSFNLLLSVQFLAMILIGGVATLSGSLLGAAFVVLLPRLVEELPRFLPFVTSQSTGGVLTTFQLQTLLYGVLIVVFLIAEPRGLFGIWVRARNYWRAWPFSYKCPFRQRLPWLVAPLDSRQTPGRSGRVTSDTQGMQECYLGGPRPGKTGVADRRGDGGVGHAVPAECRCGGARRARADLYSWVRRPSWRRC
jgi:Branched-chain amino acid transport system / permease component